MRRILLYRYKFCTLTNPKCAMKNKAHTLHPNVIPTVLSLDLKHTQIRFYPRFSYSFIRL